jgi:hypothetical protein
VQVDVFAVSRALFSAGMSIAARMAIMAITTKSSISVKLKHLLIFAADRIFITSLCLSRISDM